jgi:hypothetical protein
MKFAFAKLILVTLLWASKSHAQLDLGTEVLLKKSAIISPKDSGLQSGRYQIRANKIKTPAPPLKATEDEMSIVLRPVSNLPKKKSAASKSTVADSAISLDPEVQMVFTKPQPLEVAKPAPEPPQEPPPAVEPPVEIQLPPVLDQVKSVFTGEPPEQIAEYIERVHPDDQRLNRIESAFFSGVMSNESRSSYSYRSYSVSSPIFGFDGRLFLNPFLGLRASYLTTLAGDVDGGPTAGSRLPAKHENLELAIDMRRYFGLSRRAISIDYGFHFFNNTFSVSGDNTSRVGLRSSGLGFHFNSRFPVAPSFSWILGGKFAPRFSHQESMTGIALSSGDAQESSRFGIVVGGEFKFSRSSIFECKLSWTMDKHVYTGTASHADQNTGQTPNGVGVVNNFGILSLGYRWGQ